MHQERNTGEGALSGRGKWILVITMLLAACVLAVSLFFLGRIEGWMNPSRETELLTIVNAENPLTEHADVTMSFIDDEHTVDERCADELELMLKDCRRAGHKPLITAAYRSESVQRELLNARTEEIMAEGVGAERARQLALLELDEPGCSEHQLGLAVDLSDEADEEASLHWIAEHAWEYGFILRYPQGKENVTGHAAINNHFRYVGKDAAKQIHELDITLEEYVAMFY